MKKLYEKPDAEYIDLEIHDFVMSLVTPSDGVGDSDEEGLG